MVLKQQETQLWDGSGYGYGHGHGSGSGSGDGDGYGSGSGYGYGYGKIEVEIPVESAWEAYHYIHKNDKGFVLRSGKCVGVGEVLCESQIKLCECGLHASLTRYDAQQYRPDNSVLTQVLVWGRIIVNKDKLVATHRKIIAVLE